MGSSPAGLVRPSAHATQAPELSALISGARARRIARRHGVVTRGPGPPGGARHAGARLTRSSAAHAHVVSPDVMGSSPAGLVRPLAHATQAPELTRSSAAHAHVVSAPEGSSPAGLVRPVAHGSQYPECT